MLPFELWPNACVFVCDEGSVGVQLSVRYGVYCFHTTYSYLFPFPNVRYWLFRTSQTPMMQN